MKSKTSFFNRGLCLSLLQRSWPIWTSYFVLMLISIPGSLMQIVERAGEYERSMGYLGRNLNSTMLNAGVSVACLSSLACVLVAMTMFSFMYNNRSTSMYCSMPIKRETVFSTAFITGIVPMLIIDVLIALICLGFVGEGMMEAKNVWLFLVMALMGNVAFYGMAAFCAVLTGHILVLPAVYGVLNVAAYLAETGINYARKTLVYGFAESYRLQGFSPIVQLISKMSVQTQYTRAMDGSMTETGEYLLHGLEWLAIYCVAGLVLAVLALLIYRRRQMESCGDVVAIPILKPIFRYCMCFGVALSFAGFVYSAIFESYMRGLTEACCYLALLLCGAFIGYFAAEMLMQKTLQVFRGKWLGFIISCLILCVFTGLNEFDVFGYEKRLPDMEKVEHVELNYHDGCIFSQTENIQLTQDFHRLIIDSKRTNEYSDNYQVINLSYILKDGRSFNRNYYLSYDAEQQRDEGSCINELGRLVNVQEAIDKRAATVVPVTPDNIVDAGIDGYIRKESGEHEYVNIRLTAQQAYEFYTQCFLPDAAEGKVCRLFPVSNQEYYSVVTPFSFNFGMHYESDNVDDWYKGYKYFTMYMDAERCRQWIEENTGLEFISLAEFDPKGMEATLTELGLDMPVSTKEVSHTAPLPTPNP